jgi:glucoamylase
MPALESWIDAEARFATAAMLRAISATRLVMERPGFGQRVIPRAGSVLASPVPAHYDPDPDYFFHWFRDAAMVLDALRVALVAGYADSSAVGRFREFVQFNLDLRSIDGRAFLRSSHFRAAVQPALLEYVRPDAEIAALCGDTVLGDVRVNADGTLDFTRWSRPQSDGPALNFLTLCRWSHQFPSLVQEPALRAALPDLMGAALAFTLSQVGKPCSDVWEEQSGYHYFTQLLQAQALTRGAEWYAQGGQPEQAQACRTAADAALSRLEGFWNDSGRFYRSRAPDAAGPGRERDMSVIIALLHAERASGRHSVLDPRAQATLTTLEEFFETEYAINREPLPARAPAMGRYAGDRYYEGSAWYLATLAAAEFYFSLALALSAGAEMPLTAENLSFRQRLGATAAVGGERLARLALERGDAFVRTVQAFTPPSGELSEQFDRNTGAQTSAKHLSWSYAAFITAAARRGEAFRSIRAADPAQRPAGTAG